MSNTQKTFSGRYVGNGVDAQTGEALHGETAMLRVVDGSSTVLAQFDRMKSAKGELRALAHGWHPYPKADWTDMRQIGDAFAE